MGQKIQNLQKQLQMLEARVPCVETDREIKEVRDALNVWLDAESTMWRQCSPNFWLTDKDRNTNFSTPKPQTGSSVIRSMAFVTQMEIGRKMSSMWRISLLATLETFFTHKDQ